jgi:hypothetical protein
MSSKVLNIISKKSFKKPSIPAVAKRKLDFIIHHLMMQEIWKRELSVGRAYYRKAIPNIIIQYYKSFPIVNRMKGAALALHKTQFIKKPKNPI